MMDYMNRKVRFGIFHIINDQEFGNGASTLLIKCLGDSLFPKMVGHRSKATLMSLPSKSGVLTALFPTNYLVSGGSNNISFCPT